MNKDLSRDLITPEYYFDAQNMTLITENGQSTGSIQNTKGNLLSVTLPNTSNVPEITIDPNNDSGDIQITINTVPPSLFPSFVIPYTSTELDFYAAVTLILV